MSHAPSMLILYSIIVLSYCRTILYSPIFPIYFFCITRQYRTNNHCLYQWVHQQQIHSKQQRLSRRKVAQLLPHLSLQLPRTVLLCSFATDALVFMSELSEFEEEKTGESCLRRTGELQKGATLLGSYNSMA
jgi:hypothetical protein